MDKDETRGMVGEIRALITDLQASKPVELMEPGTGASGLALLTATGLVPVPHSLFDYARTRPVRRHGTAKLATLQSLIDHANRFKDGDSALFANPDRARPSLTAVLDYHEKVEGDQGLPRHGTHRGLHEFPLSDEWIAWQKQNAKPMGMADFAMFLEDRITDIIPLIAGEDDLSDDLKRFITATGGMNGIASPEKMIELSRGLHVHENAVVGETINLASGESSIQFASEHLDKNGKPLKVPGLFLIAIPVFKSGMFYRIAARLRYRKSGGLVFWFELWRADKAFDDAFEQSCAQAVAETGLPLFYGSPE